MTVTSTFLTASNPAQVKRNVLASFGKALLMPVTIVPKTVAYSFNAVTFGALSAVAQLTGTGSSASNLDVTSPIQTTATTLESPPEEEECLSESEEKPSMPQKDDYSKLQLLLSLDVALQLIQADRESLKRVEIFAGFSGPSGIKVRDTIEEIFIVLLQTLAEKHIVPAFQA
jgi:recyclin-1